MKSEATKRKPIKLRGPIKKQTIERLLAYGFVPILSGNFGGKGRAVRNRKD